jgi:hypothetical protein
MTTSTPTPDLSEARRLLHCNMHLVPLHAYEKRPYGDDWNAPHKRVKVIDDGATGYGLPLAANKLCSVDPDRWPLAVKGMRAIGFDLEAIMVAGVRTTSTRPDSGGRSAFAEAPDLSWLSFRSKETGTVIELRASSPNLQDCIPGVVYADKSGARRTQSYANGKRLDKAPGLPADLLVWWQRCSTDVEFLRDQERLFFNALGVAPSLSISTGRKGEHLAYPAPGFRGPYNVVHDVESVLMRHGYTEGGGGRWAPSTATGAPSVRPIPGKDGLWQSDHASDPLKGTFDAWTAHVVLDHHGDVEAAIEEELGRQAADSARSLQKSTEVKWDTPVDLFVTQPLPRFPLDALPVSIQQYAKEMSAQTGFDAGAYGYVILASAGCWVDHRAKMHITESFKLSALCWAALSDDSGRGKSQIISAGTHHIKLIGTLMEKESARAHAEWRSTNQGLRPQDQSPKPAWRQRIALDATVEALGDILEENPEGVVVVADELSEFIGRMDAYGATGGGKDRGTYLRAYDGGSLTINRRSGSKFIEQFSVGIIAGVQPAKLADMFKKSAAGGADGLYQRFLMYSPRPSKSPDYAAKMGQYTGPNVGNLFARIQKWNENGTFLKSPSALSHEARKVMNEQHAIWGTIADRTPSPRLREHLGKFPGFLGRLTFALHCLECASNCKFTPTVSVATLTRAMRILSVLHKHSEATYQILDDTTAGVGDLVRSAAEFILSKSMTKFMRGDLTRQAVGWRKADHIQSEGALDILIESGWLRDVTAPTLPGKRGRRSDGAFQVNPAVHVQFHGHAERIRTLRAERYEAVKILAAQRGGIS